MITRQSRDMLRLHRHYKNRYLPQSGGVLEQKAKYVEAMEVLESEFGKLQNEYAERARKK